LNIFFDKRKRFPQGKSLESQNDINTGPLFDRLNQRKVLAKKRFFHYITWGGYSREINHNYISFMESPLKIETAISETAVSVYKDIDF
jgi:hypothetical protein